MHQGGLPPPWSIQHRKHADEHRARRDNTRNDQSPKAHPMAPLQEPFRRIARRFFAEFSMIDRQVGDRHDQQQRSCSRLETSRTLKNSISRNEDYFGSCAESLTCGVSS